MTRPKGCRSLSETHFSKCKRRIAHCPNENKCWSVGKWCAEKWMGNHYFWWNPYNWKSNVFLFTHLTMNALHWRHGHGIWKWIDIHRWYGNDAHQNSSILPMYKLMTYLFHIFFSLGVTYFGPTSGSGERAQWYTKGNLLHTYTTINTHINSYCYCLSPWRRKKKSRSRSKSNVINAPATWITCCDWYVAYPPTHTHTHIIPGNSQ